jgi:hypothetical protein
MPVRGIGDVNIAWHGTNYIKAWNLRLLWLG